jgi:uncharacterized protein
VVTFPTQLTHPSALLSIVYFLGFWLLLWLPIAYPMVRHLDWQPFQPSSAAQKLPLLATLYGLVPLVLAGFNRLTGQTFADYGMPLEWGLLRSCFLGLMGGSTSLLLVFWLQARLGWQMPWSIPVQRSTGITCLLLLALALWIGWTEELVFRGFLQTQLQPVWSVWWAAALVSLVFALLHGLWEGQSVIPQLPGLWLMGLVLVLARQVDAGHLGLAWGLHAGWVWVIACLETLELNRFTPQAPVWLTGLNQKPLAGVIGLLFLLLTAVALQGYATGK